MFGLYHQSYLYILILWTLPSLFVLETERLRIMKNTVKYIQRSGLIFFAVLIATSALVVGAVASPAQRAIAAPSAVGGAGATLPYTEIQAENATYTGTLIDATQNRTYPGLAVEAIERRAVTLTGSQYVEFTVPASANSIVVRYSIPDGNGGAAIDDNLGLNHNDGAHNGLCNHLPSRDASL